MKPGKRGKGKLPANHGMKDFYSFYRKMYKYKPFKSKYLDKVPTYVVDYKTYANIIRDYNMLVIDEIINHGTLFKVPAGLGTIRIEKKKMKIGYLKEKRYLKVDWKKSQEYNKIIYHLNEHTDGFRYKWKWGKIRMLVQHRTAYHFMPTRAAKRRLAGILQTDRSKDYHEEK